MMCGHYVGGDCTVCLGPVPKNIRHAWMSLGSFLVKFQNVVQRRFQALPCHKGTPVVVFLVSICRWL